MPILSVNNDVQLCPYWLPEGLLMTRRKHPCSCLGSQAVFFSLSKSVALIVTTLSGRCLSRGTLLTSHPSSKVIFSLLSFYVTVLFSASRAWTFLCPRATPLSMSLARCWLPRTIIMPLNAGIFMHKYSWCTTASNCWLAPDRRWRGRDSSFQRHRR